MACHGEASERSRVHGGGLKVEGPTVRQGKVRVSNRPLNPLRRHGINAPKRILTDLADRGLIRVMGVGRGIYYVLADGKPSDSRPPGG